MSLSYQDLSDKNNERVNTILEVIIAYAQLDFSKKTEVLGNGDVLDAIGAGVNMLGEELETSTVSLREKEQLLKEVHHRVKNNLQIVASLLNLQSENILDERYLDLVKDSRNRIHSMALVHEMLYSSKDLSKIDIGEYIRLLTANIHQSYSKPGSEIVFEYDVEQGLFFDIDHMIAIGLILNEITSNSFKYAFPGNKGTIKISLRQVENGYALCSADTGIGLSKNFSVDTDAHLGIQLIFMLTEQMSGTIHIDRQPGTSYHITFPKKCSTKS
jgi:two-component sensor histidine kinase